MAQGSSLHLGLNAVDPCSYDGAWEGRLVGAVQDAEDMYAIACAQGFQASKLLEEAVTREAVIKAIRCASETLQAGDILLLTYAGHGGRLPDKSGDESDGYDETWCLYDGHLLDDELNLLWQGFAAGVRILVISDSCHSGTVTRGAIGQPRAMPDKVAVDTWRNRREFYRDLLEGMETDCTAPPAASVRLLSACREDQSAYDGLPNGFFTKTLKEVWDNGHFAGDYTRFFEQIYERMYQYQPPAHVFTGQPDTFYDTQKPFQID